MPSAVAIVAHHDDHVLWMGGSIQRLAATGWQITVVAMCVPDPQRRDYFHRTCSALGVTPVAMEFADYMGDSEFAVNNRDEMRARLSAAVEGSAFDLVFTHSRGPHGEYCARHANHVEARVLAAELVEGGEIGRGSRRLAYFSYDVIYGGGTATCARLESPYVLQLSYPELLRKCDLCSQAPDADSSLRNLGFPCPNPEGFEGDGLELSAPFVPRSV